MTHENVLGWIILVMIVGGSLGWLLQEVPSLIKKLIKNKRTHQYIKTGMYYKK
jgi:lipopolysaccharide export system protein LptC